MRELVCEFTNWKVTRVQGSMHLSGCSSVEMMKQALGAERAAKSSEQLLPAWPAGPAVAPRLGIGSCLGRQAMYREAGQLLRLRWRVRDGIS